MNMHEHILTALREQFDRWEELLASLSEAQLHAPHLPSHWSTKDEIAHLWAWQQRSIARLEAFRLGQEPEYPQWLPGVNPNAEDVDQINDWLYETYSAQPWAKVHQDWRDGYLRFIESGRLIPEKDLLVPSRYVWSGGHPIVFSLLYSYDHHQEHLDQLTAWLHAAENGVSIRGVQPQDWASVRDITLRMYTDAPQAYGETLAEAKARTTLEWQQWAEKLADTAQRCGFFAEEAQGVCGFVRGDAAMPQLPPGTVFAGQLWVEPHQRGSGLGRRLMDAVTQWAGRQGAEQLILGVTGGNLDVIQFYEHLGYSDTGMRIHLPSDPSKEIVMMGRALKPS